ARRPKVVSREGAEAAAVDREAIRESVLRADVRDRARRGDRSRRDGAEVLLEPKGRGGRAAHVGRVLRAGGELAGRRLAEQTERVAAYALPRRRGERLEEPRRL